MGSEDACRLSRSTHETSKRLMQASRVLNETIDKHFKDMEFNAAVTDPCVYTIGEGDDECVMCLYVDDMLIASREKDIIGSVKTIIAKKFRIKDLGRARSCSVSRSTAT